MATTKAVVTQQHLTDIAEAIRTKGGTTDTLLPSEMAAAIEAIPTGGKWIPPNEWPDIDEIIDQIGSEYQHCVAYLFFVTDGSVTMNCDIVFGGLSKKKIMSDSGQYIEETVTQTTQTSFTLNGHGYHWIVFGDTVKGSYTRINKPLRSDSFCVLRIKGRGEMGLFSPQTSGCRFLQSIDVFSVSSFSMGCYNTGIRQIKIKNIGSGWLDNAFAFLNSIIEADLPISLGLKNLNAMCQNNRHMESWFNEALDISGAEECSHIFYNCENMITVPRVMDFRSATIVSNCFNGCGAYNLPRYIDLSSSTNNTNAFINMPRLMELPKVIVPNKSLASDQNISFVNSPFVSKQSVIDFSNFPAIPDTYEYSGIDYYRNEDLSWKSNPSAGKTSDATGANAVWTLTLNANVKALFSGDEQAEIADKMTAHGWTLVW